MSRVKEPTAEERIEQMRKEIVADLDVRLIKFDNAYVDVVGEYCKSRLRAIGEFMDHYGAGACWQALYLRYGVDVSDSPEGWAIDDGYRPGDEWRFVYGDDEQRIREAMERARG